MSMIVIDLDGTLTVPGSGEDYASLEPNLAVVAQLKRYKTLGYRIAIMTSRNMRSFENNVGRINAHTLPIALDWLKKHDIPFDEIHVGKPWCGLAGFYVDDRALRPSEFVALAPEQVQALLEAEAL